MDRRNRILQGGKHPLWPVGIYAPSTTFHGFIYQGQDWEHRLHATWHVGSRAPRTGNLVSGLVIGGDNRSGAYPHHKMEPSHVLGWSRLVQMAATLALILGALLGMVWVATLGGAGLTLALIGSGVAKVRHYRTLPLEPRERYILAASWVAVVVGIVAVVAGFLARRFDIAESPVSVLVLGIAALGFGMIHYGLQRSWLGPLADEESES